MICKVCKKNRQKRSFYKTNKSTCKFCRREYVKNYFASLPEDKKKQYWKNWANKPENLERRTRYNIEYNKTRDQSGASKNRKRFKDPPAYYQTRKALNNGTLTKSDSCQQCFRNTRIYGHHPNYNRPLIVEWLCGSCHRQRHSRPNQDLHLYLI